MFGILLIDSVLKKSNAENVVVWGYSLFKHANRSNCY